MRGVGYAEPQNQLLGFTGTPCPRFNQSKTKSARSWTSRPPLGIGSTPMRWLISSIQTRFGHGRQTQPRMIQNIGSCPLDDSIVHDGRPAGSHCSLRTNSCTTGGKRSASRSRKSKMVPLQSSTLILCGATRKPGQNSVGSVGRARSTRRSMNGGSSFTRPAYLSTRGEA